MYWSQQKKRVFANVIKGFQGRLDLGITRYRMSDDGTCGRCWILFDGEQIASWSCLETRLHSPVTEAEVADYYRETHSPTPFEDVNAEGMGYTVDGFIKSLNVYLDGKPHRFLNSPNQLQQALAVCDRRVGRRALDLLEEREDLPGFVALLLKNRQAADKPVDGSA